MSARWGERVELQIGSTWVDVTDDALNRDPIEITRGQEAEASGADPGLLRLTLDNRSGDYSPRNPRSQYYGRLGRNTPIRVSVQATPALVLPGGVDRAVVASSSAINITGDLDVRIDANLSNWPSGEDPVELAGRWGFPSAGSWLLTVYRRRIYLVWSPDGSSNEAATSDPIPDLAGRIALRATVDVDNGAGGHVVTFYTAPTIAGPWAQLGDPVTEPGTTSVNNPSGVDLHVGSVSSVSWPEPRGRVHAFQLYDSGGLVADPGISSLADGTTAWTGPDGLSWSLDAAAEVTSRVVRFEGEVSEWPPQWDVSGRDRYVQIEAAGILRRLRKGDKPLKSALRREIEGAAPYTTWWPLEDSSGATQAAPGYPTHAPLRASGDVTFGAQALGGLAAGVALGEDGRLLNTPVAGGSSTGWVVAAWYSPPPATQWEALRATPLVQWQTTGSAALWTLYAAYDGSGVSLVVEIADSGNSFIGGDIGPASAITSGSGLPVQVLCRAVQSGSNVSVVVQADGVTVASLTLTSQTCGRVSHIGLNTRLEEEHGLTFLGSWAHLLVAPSGRYSDVIGHIAAGRGYAGEEALARAQRIADEEGIPLATLGDVSQQMGPQGVATALDLIGEAAEADTGTLYERLSPPGLIVRGVDADYNAAPALILDYGDVAPPLLLRDDDNDVVNDVTVERRGGSSARAVDEIGPLSVLAPPDGIGRYDIARTLNVQADDQLPDLAGWLLHVGTWDEARYPSVAVRLHARPELIDEALGVDVRSRIRLTGLPDWVPPGPADLIVTGYRETITLTEWVIEWTCIPGAPWNVATADDLVWGRADTDGSELAAPVGAGDTSLSVAITDGPLWTTDADDLPLDIIVGGEVMTVTDISGASSPQIFTVTRAVNGISKSHAAGADVRLAYPAIAAL